jgi:hypothetical protein
MLTTYQYTELIVGITLFIFFYLGFLYFINDDRKYFFSDIVISSIFFSIILISRYLLINYYILQSQNFSSNIIIDE